VAAEAETQLLVQLVAQAVAVPLMAVTLLGTTHLHLDKVTTVQLAPTLVSIMQVVVEEEHLLLVLLAAHQVLAVVTAVMVLLGL
jgi:hypothetical protein